MVTVEGPADAVAESSIWSSAARRAHYSAGRSSPGPARGPLSRLILRCPLAGRRRPGRAVRDVLAIRSARKSEGALRVRVDPVLID